MNKPAQNVHTQTAYILNGKQRAVLAATAIVMVAMLLFPPFHVMREDHEVMALGYHFFMQFNENGAGREPASVDKEMLLIQLAATFLVGVICAAMFHSRKPEHTVSNAEMP